MLDVSALINEACPEASLGIESECCGTARVCASSPSGLQMEAAVGTLPASDSHPAAFAADSVWKLLWGSLSSAKMRVREQLRVDTCVQEPACID